MPRPQLWRRTYLASFPIWLQSILREASSFGITLCGRSTSKKIPATVEKKREMHEILVPQLFLMSNVLAINFQIGKKRKKTCCCQYTGRKAAQAQEDEEQ